MAQSPEESHRQSLVDHLSELRSRLIKTGYIIVLGGLLCWYFSESIFNFIRQPITPFLPNGGLVYTGMMDKFMAYVKISALSGVLLTCPFWLYQIWCFVAPGLYKKEKRYMVGFLSFGTLLFLSGVAFVYFLVYPLAFHYLMNFGSTVDKPMITIDSYISFFFLTTTLIFGLAFELPLFLVILAMVGVIDQVFLKKNRRYAIVILAIVSAIITPPDLLSMTMLMVPLLFLYELSIILVRLLVLPKNV